MDYRETQDESNKSTMRGSRRDPWTTLIVERSLARQRCHGTRNAAGFLRDSGLNIGTVLRLLTSSRRRGAAPR